VSNIHILERNGPKRARVALHMPVPSGNNSAGFTWKSVLLAAGRAGVSALTEGTGPGQITTAEKASVVAGDVLELILTIEVPSSGTGPQRLAALDENYTALSADYLTRLQEEFKFYGLAR